MKNSGTTLLNHSSPPPSPPPEKLEKGDVSMVQGQAFLKVAGGGGGADIFPI